VTHIEREVPLSLIKSVQINELESHMLCNEEAAFAWERDNMPDEILGTEFHQLEIELQIKLLRDICLLTNIYVVGCWSRKRQLSG
jgi:hypothetical protein